VWGPPIELPLVPVAAANLPDGRVLLWSAWAKDDWDNSVPKTQTAIWDPETNAVTEREVSETGHDMFCPGIANMPDGRILVSGGSSNKETSIYDPATGDWGDAPDMNQGRGYQTTVTLADGNAFTFGGSWNGGDNSKYGEIWTGDRWEPLNDIRPENGTTAYSTPDRRGP